MADITIQRGNSTVSPIGPLYTRRTNYTAQAASDFGNALSRKAELQRQKEQDANDAVYISNSLIEAEISATNMAEELQQAIPQGEGYSQEYINSVRGIHQGFIDNAPSDNARKKLQEQLTTDILGRVGAAHETETRLKIDSYLASNQDATDKVMKDLIRNPSVSNFKLAQERLNILEAARPTFISKQRSEAISRANRAQLMDVFLSTQAETDIAAARNMIKSEEFQRDLDPEEQLTISKKIIKIDEANQAKREKEEKRKIEVYRDRYRDQLSDPSFPQAMKDQLMLHGIFDSDEIAKLEKSDDELPNVTRGSLQIEYKEKLLDGDLDEKWFINNRSNIDKATYKKWYNEFLNPETSDEFKEASDLLKNLFTEYNKNYITGITDKEAWYSAVNRLEKDIAPKKDASGNIVQGMTIQESLDRIVKTSKQLKIGGNRIVRELGINPTKEQIENYIANQPIDTMSPADLTQLRQDARTFYGY